MKIIFVDLEYLHLTLICAGNGVEIKTIADCTSERAVT